MKFSVGRLIAVAALIGLAARPMAATIGIAHAETRIGAVSTNFRLLGADDKVVVERLEDPKLPNVACYASFAKTGGVKGSLGVATDPSRFALSCIATGPVTLPTGLPAKKQIAAISASFLVKHFNLYRLVDPDHKAVVYMLISTKIIHGSPANAVSAVPVSGG
ncbi:CreA family protein [Acidiphilium sp. PA]|uniref:CreA family protein n=1 Tax=Acidiphilium sp. PA TaxID=2871705 RepID=UPI0022447339|nr:CreA family protein [Acidiphilium sp. PA]MCW8305515.1 CreA family protein [Acidiphilium sp. PA]